MITTTEDGAYCVSCTETDCPRPLMRIVASAAHAGNLERKHEREFHGTAETERAELVGLLADTADLTLGEIADEIIAAGWIRAPF